MWFRRKVKKGHQIGRELGHPTLNLNVGNFGLHYKPAVYNCQLKIKNKAYNGALYFGPKLGKPGNILEISVLDFSVNIYNQFISFKIGKKIREPKVFSSVDDLKKQITSDKNEIHRSL